MANLGMYQNFVVLLAPVDQATANPGMSAYLDLANARRATIVVQFGVITSATATDTMLLQLECSTSTTSNATEEFIPFKYRISAAAGTGTWGAVTDVTTAGVSLGASTVFDGMAVLIDVDPAEVQAKMADARYVRAVWTPGGDGAYTVILASAVAIVEPIYQATTMIDATS